VVNAWLLAVYVYRYVTRMETFMVLSMD